MIIVPQTKKTLCGKRDAPCGLEQVSFGGEKKKEVTAAKHDFQKRIVRIHEKQGRVSEKELITLVPLCDEYRGTAYRETPNLKAVYKIPSKTKLVPLKTRHRYPLSRFYSS